MLVNRFALTVACFMVAFGAVHDAYEYHYLPVWAAYIVAALWVIAGINTAARGCK